MAAAPAATSPWIIRFHPVPEPRVRLVCFPHAGGSASYYFPVSRVLSSAAEVLVLQYPGRQDRRDTPFIDNITELADAVTAELRGGPDVPTALFGHSMGATLAFEVARRLERHGEKPLALFASGRRAPAEVKDEGLHKSSDAELIDHVARLSGTGMEVLRDPDIVRMVLPVLRSDYRAAETYRYQPGEKLTCPVYALTGDNDPQVSTDEADAWTHYTDGPFEKKVFDGGHFFFTTGPEKPLAYVAERLTALTSGTA
ncbi:alpha/beta fold hydrolase [Streptomyces sp. NBC_00838]|uniref:thioesterase II family protein n=1 Tax=Streptomyces sp. NBC_00838 TaxID=2903680 RepID=UPI00386EE130|nr:alpha/beta fold hydrolase [Streptomyces sp. NBC_00838]